MVAKTSKPGTAHTRRVLEFLAHTCGELEDWKRGDVVQVPSPSIEDRTDIVVIVIPYDEIEIETEDEDDRIEITWPAGMIIRNAGEYSAEKSESLADQMACVIKSMAPTVPGVVHGYSDEDRMIGETDPDGHWLDFVSHPRAMGMLRRLKAEDRAKKSKKSRGVAPRRKPVGK